MFEITAKQDTWLKKQPIQSNKLSEAEKAFCTKDKSYKVITHRKENNHIRVELAYSAGIWYIWNDHWKNNWDDDHIDSNHPVVLTEIKQLKAYTGKLDLDTSVTYYSQRDNPWRNKKQSPFRTCNSSSNAMYLDWMKRATGQKGLNGDNAYIDNVFKYGDTIYHDNQTKSLKDYGCNTKWNTDGNIAAVNGLLKVGIPVVVNILHRGTLSSPSGGHVLILIGRKEGQYITHDPFGTLLSNYGNHNGAYSIIPENDFKIRWQRGWRDQQ